MGYSAPGGSKGGAEELAEKLGMPLEKVRKVLKIARMTNGDARCAECQCFSRVSSQPIRSITTSGPSSARPVIIPKR